MSELFVVKPIELPQSGFAALADEAKAEGHRFLQRMSEEWADRTNRFALPGEVMFGAFDDERLIGVGGLNLCPYSDDVRIGRLRHLFVERKNRNKGIAGALLTEILDSAVDSFKIVRLRTNNSAAIALYEKRNFIQSKHPQASHELLV